MPHVSFTATLSTFGFCQPHGFDKLYTESIERVTSIPHIQLVTGCNSNLINNHKLCIDIRYRPTQASTNLLSSLKAISQNILDNSQMKLKTTCVSDLTNDYHGWGNMLITALQLWLTKSIYVVVQLCEAHRSKIWLDILASTTEG